MSHCIAATKSLADIVVIASTLAQFQHLLGALFLCLPARAPHQLPSQPFLGCHGWCTSSVNISGGGQLSWGGSTDLRDLPAFAPLQLPLKLVQEVRGSKKPTRCQHSVPQCRDNDEALCAVRCFTFAVSWSMVYGLGSTVPCTYIKYFYCFCIFIDHHPRKQS